MNDNDFFKVLFYIFLAIVFIFTIVSTINDKNDCKARHCSAGKAPEYIRYQGCVCIERPE